MYYHKEQTLSEQNEMHPDKEASSGMNYEIVKNCSKERGEAEPN